MKPAIEDDSVAVPPVVLGKLHFIEQQKFIGNRYEVEVTLPRDVIGLENDDRLPGHVGTRRLKARADDERRVSGTLRMARGCPSVSLPVQVALATIAGNARVVKLGV